MIPTIPETSLRTHAMSVYEDYHRTSQSYDETRVPIGADILASALSRGARALADVELLDAGCGTGAYAQAMSPLVRRVHAVDLNEGMLSVARRKLAAEEAAGRIVFRQGAIDALPFAESGFDAAMINQVLHHLEDGGDDDWPRHAAVFEEMQRVLRPGGVLVVNSCTHAQLRDGFWYYDLVPEARDACMRRHLPADRLEGMLARAGFRVCGRETPLEAVMQGDSYFDPTGPLREAWRRGDSFWALASGEQVARAESRIREMAADGTLDAWFRARDDARRRVGQFTFFVALRR